MGTTELTEYDLVTVGDEACLNEDCTLLTHLFEDRVMKVSTVHVGARCTVGRDAVVLSWPLVASAMGVLARPDGGR
jgi:acetyltransferase-like isoleucine patch superfamily enzyme